MPPVKPSEDARVRAISVEALMYATKATVGKHEHLEHYLKRLTHLSLNGDAKRVVRRIENLHHCPSLRVLYLYDNEICAIEHLDAVPQLTHLHLQQNLITRMENLACLVQLEKLYLDGNRIARLEGLKCCYYLQELHLSNQQLDANANFSFDSQSLQALSRSLRVLNLSNCRVSCAAPLAMLRGLEQLDLSKNAISELEDVFALLSALSALTELDLSQNLVTTAPKYREKVITFSSSRLALLDKKDVDANQRRMMQSHLAHKFRKRQESEQARDAASAATSAASEMRRAMKHGAAVHQLRSIAISSTAAARSAKTQFERDGLGIAGASCSSNSSSALVRLHGTSSSSSSSNNNKHH